MEEGRGPPPDQVSHNSALKSLASAPFRDTETLDRVGVALSIRQRMAQRELQEDEATRTLLLAIFSDSPLAEAMMADGMRLNAEQAKEQEKLEEVAETTRVAWPAAFS